MRIGFDFDGLVDIFVFLMSNPYKLIIKYFVIKIE